MDQKSSRFVIPLAVAGITSIVAFSSIGIAAITGHLPITQPSLNAFAVIAKDGQAGRLDPVSKVAPASIHQGLTRSSRKLGSDEKLVNFRRGARVTANHNVCSTCGVIDSISPIDNVAATPDSGMVEGEAAGLGMDDAKYRDEQRFMIIVRMEDGTIRTIQENQQPAFGVGERVKLVNGSIIPMG